MSQSIQRLTRGATGAFARTIERADRPVILEGGLGGRAAEIWSFDWFRDQFGAVEVKVGSGRYVRGGEGAVYAGPPVPMRLADYIDRLHGRGPRVEGYLSGFDIVRLIPTLEGHVQLPEGGPLSRFGRSAFWMAPEAMVTQLHFDRTHNLFAQVAGRKRFQLYAPARREELSPVRVHWALFISEMDLDRYSVGSFDGGPRPDHDFVLEPGDVLFLPFDWWHRVLSFTPSISANRWWWSPRLILRHGPRALADAAIGRMRRREPVRPAAST